MSATIRPCRPEDAETLVDLVRELAVYEKLERVRAGHPRRLPRATCSAPGRSPRRSWPRSTARRWASRCSSTTFSTFRGQPGLYLEDLFVRQAHRGRGIGKALLEAVARIAVERRLRPARVGGPRLERAGDRLLPRPGRRAARRMDRLPDRRRASSPAWPTSPRHQPRGPTQDEPLLPPAHRRGWPATCRASSRATAASSSSTRTRTRTPPRPASPRRSPRPSTTGSGSIPTRSATAFRQVAARLHGVEPDMILAGNGSDDLLTIITRAFVGAGDLVVYPTPSYILYRTLVELQDARESHVPVLARLGARPRRLRRPRRAARLPGQPEQPLGHGAAARAGRRAGRAARLPAGRRRGVRRLRRGQLPSGSSPSTPT